jgi:[CysO sulfur-carrier protein]-S-L-cysteine hydrolase
MDDFILKTVSSKTRSTALSKGSTPVSIPFRLVLPTRIRDEMFAHARAECPNECCGQLAGHISADGTKRVVKHYPLVNTAASPTKYRSDGKDLFAASRDMRESGLELLAIYHSHPSSHPVPSATDLRQNNYGAETVNFIISLQGDTPVMRGWLLGEAAFTEVEWD